MKVLLGLWLSVFACGTAAAADRLPKSMLGRWASDPAACAERSSEAGMKVEARTVWFYEQSQSVRRIARLKDGTLRVSGHSEDLDGRAWSSITMKQLGPDRLLVQEQVFHRCPPALGGAARPAR